MSDFIRPAVRAVPSSMAGRIGRCLVSLVPEVEAGVASQWTGREQTIEIAVSTAETEEHDVAMELLVCIGQALWEKLTDSEVRSFLGLLDEEISAGVDGEIDEQALAEKRSLLAARSSFRTRRSLMAYARASFAATAAEYVHCLWHDVTVRIGPEHLPPPRLRRRLEMLARWFPPDRGYRLFPAAT